MVKRKRKGRISIFILFLIFSVFLARIARGENFVKNGGFETGKFSPWTLPQQSHTILHWFSISDGVSYEGKYSICAQGQPYNKYNSFNTLVQKINIKPIPGALYRISGYAKANISPGEKKKVSIAVREIDAQGLSICYQEAFVAPNKNEWTFYSKTFIASKKTVAFAVYLILRNLDKKDIVYFDNISFEKIGTSASKPFTVKKTDTSSVSIKLISPELKVTINKSTGLLDSLVLTKPTPKVLHPSSSLTTCIFFQNSGKEILFRKDRTPLQRSNEKISAKLLPTNKNIPLKAKITYQMTEDYFKETVIFEATEEIKEISSLGIRHGFISSEWKNIICSLRPIRVIKSNESTIFSYKEKEDDLNLSKLDTWQSVIFPMTVLEGKDRFVLIGDLCVDNFVTVSPNKPKGYFPSLQQNPTYIKKGDKFLFSFIYKVFPKKDYLLRDVWRWYGSHIYSDNPLIENIVRYRDHPVRILSRGCFASATWFKKEREERLFPSSNIWWFGWHDWINERYPTKGKWYTRIYKWEEGIPVTAEKMKDEINKLQKKGHKIYLYFRQVANLKLREKNKLPKDWFKKTPGGALEVYGGGYKIPLPEKIQKVVGYKSIPWGTYNFDNPDFRKYYLKQVKDCISYYHPDGVAWDMGWDPNHLGIFAVQSEVYKWMKKKYSTKKVISNESTTPTQFYSDAILLENGILGGKSWYDFEVAKSFNTAIICAERYNLFDTAVANALRGKKTWLSERGLKENKRFLDFLLSQKPELKADEDTTSRLCQIRTSLYDMGMGASPGYLEEAKPVPVEMVKFAGDILGIPLVTKSFVIQLTNGCDHDGNLYASGWINKKHIRLALYNNSSQAKKTRLLVDAFFLKQRGWFLKKNPSGIQVFITPFAIAEEGNFKITLSKEGLILEGKISPFTGLLYFEDK